MIRIAMIVCLKNHGNQANHANQGADEEMA